MAAKFIIDAGPVIHLSQIEEISLLKKFSPLLILPASVFSEISIGDSSLACNIKEWKNISILAVKDKIIPEIEKTIIDFCLHQGERDVIYLARVMNPAIVLTDDLDARSACEALGIEVHGTVGIIAYAFYHKWISLKKAENSLIALARKSSLFITTAIIENAIKGLKNS